MKHRALLIASLCIWVVFSPGSAFPDSLDNWHWRNPLPDGNPIPAYNAYGITFANGKFVAVGESGIVFISSDTTNWTRLPTAVTNSLFAIFYTNGLFVAVGNGGSVESSADGTNWIASNSGVSNSLRSVVYGNGTYTAVGNGGVIITSADGSNWSLRTSGTSGDFKGVTYGSAGFMAIGPTNFVFQSSDGVVWTNQILTAASSTIGAPMVHDVITFASGVYIIASHRATTSASITPFIFASSDGNAWTTNAFGAVSALAGGFIYEFLLPGNGVVMAAGKIPPLFQFSSDGVNWTNATTTGISQGSSGAYGNGKFVVLDGLHVVTSTDGLNWTNHSTLPPNPIGPSGTFGSVAYGNGAYVVVGGSTVVRSTNGLSYEVVSNTPSLSAVSYIANGFVGVGSGGKIYQSSDGISWTQRNSSTFNGLHGVASGNGLLVAVGDNGTIQTSPTGTIWTSRTSGTSFHLYGIIYTNGLFVTVGYLGTVLTSSDGINWSGQYSGQLTNLMAVTYGPAGFLAVGPGGTILTSTDATNWITQSSGATASFESVTFGNGYYLASGSDSVVVTSPDGITWTSRDVGATGGQTLFGTAFINNRFIVVGSGGTVLESDSVLSLFGLEIQRGTGFKLIVFASVGSNFRIQACTNIGWSSWVDVASFTNVSAVTQWTDSVTNLDQRFYRGISP